MQGARREVDEAARGLSRAAIVATLGAIAAAWLGAPTASLLFAGGGGLALGLLLGGSDGTAAPRPTGTRRPPHADLVGRAAALSVLGLPMAADTRAIRTRYRALAHEHHPDKAARAGVEAAEAARRRMARINAAYSALMRQREGAA
jgi:DnaJ-domain-containing protein 1